MRRATPPDREAGFSLLEALLALLLMMIILSALGIMTAQWLPVWDRGFAHMQRAATLAAGVGRLADDLAAAEYVTAGGAGDPLLFDGGAQEVTFVRTRVGPNARIGLEIVHIGPGIDRKQPALLRTTAPFAIFPGGVNLSAANFAHPVALARAPLQVRFAYMGEDGRWRAEWRGQKRLPRAIEIVATDAAGARVMSAVATLGAQVPARCVGAKTLAQCDNALSGGAAPAAKGADE